MIYNNADLGGGYDMYYVLYILGTKDSRVIACNGSLILIKPRIKNY